MAPGQGLLLTYGENALAESSHIRDRDSFSAASLRSAGSGGG
jgi:hypothetical protein